MDNIKFQIDGMHCEACAKLSAKAILKVSGIKTAEVDYETGLARVEYDAAVASIDKIKEAVAGAGYRILI